MKIILNSVLAFSILFFCISDSGAIPKDLKAKSEYLMAESKFNAGNFITALKHLKNARKLSGKTYTDIQYLMVKSYWELGKYKQARRELEKYFEVTPKGSTDIKKFDEMVILISRIEEKISEGVGETVSDDDSEQYQGNKTAKENQPVNDMVTAYEKAYGTMRIPLDVARKEGITSPPYNTVVGKKYTHRETSVTSGARSNFLRINKIVGYIVDQSIFLFEQVSIDQTKKPPQKGESSLFKLRENGTCNSAAESFFFKDFKCIGDDWPKGSLKTGDMWLREVSWGTFKSVSTYMVDGFQKIKGHDCISIKVSSVNYHGGSPSKSNHTFFWDYNKGVLVLQTMQIAEGFSKKTELVSVEFPKN